LSPYSFLAALPAVLGFAGFVLYQFLGTNRSGDEITRHIVDKLRKNAPSKVERDHRLSESQLERLPAGDQGLQRLTLYYLRRWLNVFLPLEVFAIGLKRRNKVGGADGIRTHDLLDAIEARSQLRHGPT
jgi:hypothetical protein